MREPRPKEKVREYVPLPDDLVQFLRYVHEQIERGESVAMIPSEDLLHSERVYGGVTEEGGDFFRFTYLPKTGNGGAWYFTMHKTTIEMGAIGPVLAKSGVFG